LVGSSECGGKLQLLTRGDALAACDQAFDQSEVLGAVVKIARDGRQIPVVSRPNEPISIGLRHSAFLRRMALKIHGRPPSVRNKCGDSMMRLTEVWGYVTSVAIGGMPIDIRSASLDFIRMIEN